MTVIHVEKLCRTYVRYLKSGFFKRREAIEIPAVRDLSFSIQAGERVAFIGPNGAGKTTTLRMLTGLLYPTSGHVQVAGRTPWESRMDLARHIGLVFGQRSQLWPDLPVIEAYDALRVIYGIDDKAYQVRRDRLVDLLQIGDFLKQSAKSLSLGQRMRCEIAASLLHAPKVLFLDEPTIGLDVEAKAILRDYLRGLNRTDDTTIVLTSHDTGDIEDVCDRVIMIDHGQKILDQPLSRLQQDFDSRRRIVVTTPDPSPAPFPIDGVQVETGLHRLSIDLDTRQFRLPDVIAQLQAHVTFDDLVIERTSLEQIIRDIYARGVTQ